MASKFINNLVHYIHFGLIITIYSLIIVAYIKINATEYNYMQSIGKNWNESPIMSISSGNGFCPLGTTFLLSGKWPGTIEGCDCSSLKSNIIQEPLQKESCSSLQSKYKNSNSQSNENSFHRCLEVPAIAPIPYKSWAGNEICAQRHQLSYFNLTIVDYPTKCPLGTKICGKIDSLGNFLCFPSSAECPINKINLIEKNGKTPADFNYTVVPLEKNKNITYTTSATSPEIGEILIEFRVSEGLPCLNPSLENVNSDQYILSLLLEKNGCEETGDNNQMFDKRYRLIDSDDLLNFYSMNNIEEELKKLPQYKPTSSLNSIELYGRKYIGLTEACRERIISSREGAEGLLNTMINFEDNIGGILCWILGGLIVASIAFAYEIIVPCFYCFNENNKLNKIPAKLLIGHFLIEFTLFLLGIFTYLKLSNLPNNYMLLKGSCSDFETNLAIENFIGNYGIGVKMSYLSLGLISVTFFYNFLFIFLGVIKRIDDVDERERMVENEDIKEKS